MISVITTIFEPTENSRILSLKNNQPGSIIIIGDNKGPKTFDLKNSRFYSLDEQLKLDFNLSGLLPTGHYSRKNLGYLIAIRKGEECIYETDDDNAPNEFWQIRDKRLKAVIAKNSGWVNVYKHFTDKNIWPRGFLLKEIGKPESAPFHDGSLNELIAPIQQGLADLSPDVDAIWRLTQDQEFHFERNESIALPAGAWCPFNTQSTWWWKEAFPLLYLPSYCSFRMTDIWKSFVAQRCLWEMGHMMAFHAPEVNQERNQHDLMKDFEAEIPGYTLNEKLTQTLEKSKLHPGIDNALRNMVICYEDMITNKLLPQEEMTLVKAWVEDVEKLLY